MKLLSTILALLLTAPIAHALSTDPKAAPDADVRTAFDAVIAAGGFHGQVEGNVFGPGTPRVRGDIDAIFPDRIHLRSDDLEFIVMPQGAWISALGFWAPTDPSLLPVTAFDVGEMRKAIASIRDVQFDGRAKSGRCGDVRVYRFRASGQLPGMDAAGDIKLWICESNGRPARIEAGTQANERVSIDFDWSRKPQVREP